MRRPRRVVSAARAMRTPPRMQPDPSGTLLAIGAPAKPGGRGAEGAGGAGLRRLLVCAIAAGVLQSLLDQR